METKYTTEFKATVAYEICVLGKSTSKMAEDYGVPLKTVEKWVTRYNKNPEAFNAARLTDAERIKVLEAENARLRQTNDILKKTLILLAKKD